MQTLFLLHRDAHIAHLDIKPGNVMKLSQGREFDDLRLIDFGFADECTGNLPQAIVKHRKQEAAH